MGRPRDEHGFTLLELMIVIVVLGILAGIVLFRVGAFRDEAVASACSTDVRTLLTANAAYVVHTGDDAPTIQALIDAGYLNGPPKSGVTFANGHTSPATTAACATELAFTDPPGGGGPGGGGGSGGDGGDTPTPVTIGLASVAGTTTLHDHTDDWTAVVTVTVRDSDGNPVDGASVSGAWDDGVTPSGCTTGGGGSCSFTSDHTTDNPSVIVKWTLSSVTASGASMGTNAASSLSCRRAGGPDNSTTCS